MRPPLGNLSFFEHIIHYPADPAVLHQPADTLVVYGWAGDSTSVGLGYCTPSASQVRPDMERVLLTAGQATPLLSVWAFAPLQHVQCELTGELICTVLRSDSIYSAS
jgi:hypothetical protein